MKIVSVSVVAVIVTVVFSVAPVFAAPLDKIQFIKISPQDSKAVIRGIGGKMQVIKPGDTVVENVTVKEIAPGRIILEEKTVNGLETLIIRMNNGKSRIERMHKQPEINQQMVAPATPQK